MVIMQFVLCSSCFHCCFVFLLIFLPDVSRSLFDVMLIFASVSMIPCTHGAFSILMSASGAGSAAGCSLCLRM